MDSNARKRGNPKTALLLALKLAVTIGCFYYLYQKIGGDLGTTLTSLDHVSWSTRITWLILGLITAGASIACGVYRWRLMLDAQEITVPWWKLTYLSLLGVLFGVVSLGAIATDAVKIIPLCREHPDKKWGIGISIVADHLAGFFAMLVLALTCTLPTFHKLQTLGFEARSLLIFGAVSLVGATVFLVFFFWLSIPSMRARARRFSPKFFGHPRFESALEASDLIRINWKRSLLAFLVSFPLLIFYFLTFYCGLKVCGVSVNAVPVIAAMPVVDFVASIPISISGFGIREGSLGILLEALAKVPQGSTAAGSLVGFALNTAWGIPAGIWMLFKKDPIKHYVHEDETEAPT